MAKSLILTVSLIQTNQELEVRELTVEGEHHELVMMLASLITAKPELLELFAHATLEANAQLKHQKNEQKPTAGS